MWKLFPIPCRTFCWKTASKPHSMSAEMILSMDWSESVANSRMEAAFLCKSGDDVFRIPTSRPTAAESKLCKRSQSMQICNKSIKCKLLVKSQVTDETCFSIYEKHETAMERESCRKSHSMVGAWYISNNQPFPRQMNWIDRIIYIHLGWRWCHKNPPKLPVFLNLWSTT